MRNRSRDVFFITSCHTLLALFAVSVSLAGASGDFSRLRSNMVSGQIEARGVEDPRVLEAMRKVPRHLFVPESDRHLSYRDHPLPIGEGQTISQPYIVAFMTETLQLQSDDRVLEIGTGSGYQAAVLAEIVREVYTIEIIESLGKRARRILEKLGYKNVHVKIGDGYKGWPEMAPFDAVIVTCAPHRIPTPLVEQLAEGGRMIIPVGETGGVQNLVKGVKRGDKLETRGVLPVRFVPMLRSTPED